MSETVINEVRRGFYLDSVALMRLSREVAAQDGVIEAALMMGSPSNLGIMRDAGLLDGDCDARANDLVLALKARDQDAAEAARVLALRELDRPRGASTGSEAWRPRTLAAAVADSPTANLALISVPGDFAAAEARKALRRNLNVMMFSDNVSIADEKSLKEEARERGLLMMGPDCGTAIINGTPLAFANKVRAGGVGVIGASGTGIQEITCLISEAGGGISHAIGVGGRDLRQEIGGITTLMAMDVLEEDTATEAIVLVSKPPHPSVARNVLQRIARSAKSYVVCFIGAEEMDLPANARQADTLLEAAELALGGHSIGGDFSMAGAISERRKGRIEGLYSGGTLAAEAQLVLRAAGRRIVANAPVPGIEKPGAGITHQDRVFDLGDDEYTQGKPHPMIDPSVRDGMLEAALQDRGVAVILLDLVIGYGAHADPAGHVAEVIASTGPEHPPVVASVTGTTGDPQGRARQVETLSRAGVIVAPSNFHACRIALEIAGAPD